MKENKTKKIILIILAVICVAVLVFSLYQGMIIYIPQKQEQQRFEELKQIVEREREESSAPVQTKPTGDDTQPVYTEEENPAVRELLQADHDFLDEIQLEMSSARRFMFAVRFRREKPEQIFGIVSQVQKNISEHGFSVKRMDKAEIKRMLALYFGASIIGDEIPDIEGENYIKEADTNEEKN